MPFNVSGLYCAARRFLLYFASVFVCQYGLSQNAIVTENAKAGTPQSQWDIVNNGDGTYGDKSIQGFGTDISVNKGSSIGFKITITTGTNFQFGIKIYRIGYYNGSGARLIADLGTSFVGQNQAACSFDNTTGLTDCGNWTTATTWTVPSTAVSGLYVAKLTRSAAGGGGSSHIAFVVRDDASTSALCFKTSDATWQAYNNYGGYSLYVGAGMPNNHGIKVSYNRPFLTRDGGGGGGSAEDWFMNAEYPMIRFLERNGFDMSYMTDVDMVRNGGLLLNHQVIMSVGHDEYWSKEERNSIEAARTAGKDLAFFSGNECYWKTRWENSVDGTNTPLRTMVCYKEGTMATPGENACGGKCDPTTEWTGLWRDGCSFPNDNACKPENALSGEISWDGTIGTMQVPAAYKSLRFWRNTSIATMAAGSTATLTFGTLGYEWDWEQFQSSYPPGRITMSSTTLDGRVHKLSFYKASSGSLVFGAGSVQWSWGLDSAHDRGTEGADPRMQQATINLFADMGVQPGTLQSGLVAATASTDNTAPTVVITSPANGGSTSSVPVTIQGTASDASAIGVVEISFDGGATWTQATGTNSWSYAWTPPANGTYTIKVRGVDDSGNYLPWSSATSITYTVNATSTGPFTVFGSPSMTLTSSRDNATGIVVGMKFRASSSGTVSGILFYKASTNTGTHTGLLFNSSGTLLAQATFTNETASGWQQVNFSSPVAINANQTYVAAYLSPSGFYSSTSGYFTTAVQSGPLTALQDGTDGPNGVYTYSATPAMPVSTFQQSNYWVDLVFNTGSGNTVTANAGPDQNIFLPTSSATLNGSASTGNITTYSWTQVSGPNTATIASPTAVSTSVTGLVQGSYTFQLSVNGGASTDQVVVTVNPASSGITIFTTQTPTGVTKNDGRIIEVGVKFRSSTAGFVTGVRFYKTTGNNGTHTGELYNSSGSRMAQAVFSGESASGWQTVTFASPVAISANTTYVASYFSSNGTYTNTPNYFISSVQNGPLTALADGTSGPNGVYIYTTVPAYPNSTFSMSNYWVDVVFSGNSTVVANAGPNQNITLPASSATLDGSASTGNITSYAWSTISGPNTPTITSPTSVSTTVTGLIQGTYTFQLSVNGGASTSQMTITVSPAVVANAGPNQTIVSPASSVTLDGSASTGNITSYAWSRISGPNSPAITSPTSVSTTVTGLIQGTYVFQLSVNGGASTSQVTITVSPSNGIVANAGPDQTITLPTSTAMLDGSASSGNITTYSWTQVSGPNTATIASPTAVSTSISGLVQGAYTFQLSVNGGASTDQVNITVNAASAGNTTIFTTQTPTGVTKNDGRVIEVGVKFRSNTAGFILGVRFYKTTGNNGTHTGELYSSTGTRMAQAVFTGETASGWQTVTFASPVAISANTTYIASYFSSNGTYTNTISYFTTAVQNGPLTALANGTDGPNGVYIYTTTPAFPNSTFSASNYWVDAIFNTSATGSNASNQVFQEAQTTQETGQKLVYDLGQNYPNPFSQISKIKYSIPSPAFVEMALFDAQGREIKILINEMKEAGEHVFELDGSNLAKGVYYYRMRSGNFVATRKLMIL